MYAHKPTSPGCKSNERTGIIRSLAGLTIHEPLRPAKDAAIHTSIHEDSKSLLNNRTAKVHIFYYTCAPLQSDEKNFMII